MTKYEPPTTPQGAPYSFEPFLQTPQEDQGTNQSTDSWRIRPPVFTAGRLAAVKLQSQSVAQTPQDVNKNMYAQQPFPSPQVPFRDTSPQAPAQGNSPLSPQAPAQGNSPLSPQAPAQDTSPLSPQAPAQGTSPLSPQAPAQGNSPLFRVSFMGPDQQWYRINAEIGQGNAVASPPPQTQPQSALQPSWNQTGYSDPPTLVNASAVAPGPMVEPEQPQDEASTSRAFILQYVQPGLAGLMDGSVSTLAPIFAVAFATHQPFTTFLVGMASALGAGISMTFAEALSDDGEQTGRGKPFIRGGVTGVMTFLSGAGHALPFLITNLQVALIAAYIVVAIELLVISAIRHKFFGTKWGLSIAQVVGGGALVFVTALLLGNA